MAHEQPERAALARLAVVVSAIVVRAMTAGLGWLAQQTEGFKAWYIAPCLPFQNEARWGLCLRDELPPLDLASFEPGDIAEVRLRVGGQEVLLRAAEVYEERDGSLRMGDVKGRLPSMGEQACRACPAGRII